MNLEWAPSQTMVPTPGPVDVLAFFDHRTGIESLSMVKDLGGIGSSSIPLCML